jgi:streptogramin lyase
MKRHNVGPVALLVCALLVAGCGGNSPNTTQSVHPPTITPASSLPSAGTISATIPGLGALSKPYDGYRVAADNTAVWVYNPDTGDLLRIDPTTNQIVATIAVGPGCDVGCGAVAIGQGAVWVAADGASKVVRIDPQTNKIVATIPITPNKGLQVFVTPGAVWVTDFLANTIFRIDPATNKVVSTLTNQQGANGVAFSAGSLWLCNAHASPTVLVRLNPTTMQVQAQIDLTVQGQFLNCAGMIALAQAVWVGAVAGPPSNGTTAELERINPTTNQVDATAPIPGANNTGFAADAQGVWLLDFQMGLIQFNPQTAQVARRLALTGGVGMALGAGAVWVAKGDGTLLRITPTA